MDAGTEAKLAKLKTQLEDIEGRKIEASPEQLISLVFPIASHTYLALHQSDNDAWVTKRRIIFPLPICTDSRLLDSSGLSATGTDGKLVFRLRNFLCGRDGIAQFDEPVNVLATPQGQQPRREPQQLLQPAGRPREEAPGRRGRPSSRRLLRRHAVADTRNNSACRRASHASLCPPYEYVMRFTRGCGAT